MSVIDKTLLKRIIFAVVFLLSLSIAPALYAVDVLSQFNTTIEKLEISKDGGASYVAVLEGNTVPVNLVALSGSSVGSFLGQAKVAAGSYNRARVKVTTATLVFTVDGTGVQGGTNLSAGTTGTLTIDTTTVTGGPRFPIVQEHSISVSCQSGGTVTAVIDFDARSSFSGLTYTDNDGAGAGTDVTLTALNFAPVIQVSE
jgi:hypothetical protein